MVREIPTSVARGFLMGAADIVPGVSGGTVALVLGIYRRLVRSISTASSALGRFLRGDLGGGMSTLRRVEWNFVLSLVAGIGLAVLALSHVLERTLADRPIEMAALFTGLVAGSVVITWQLLERRDATRLTIMAATAVGVFVVLGLRPGTTDEVVAQLSSPAPWAFFGAGAVAICAMILPGISGSFILVMLGMYGPVLGAVTDRDVLSLGIFVLGTVVGLALFSQGLHWALDEHYDSVMAVLIGLMVGSMRVLWPWPDGVDSTVLGRPDDSLAVALVIGLVAAVFVVAVSTIAARMEHRTAQDGIEEIHGV